jgi:hypothetical protein
VNIEARERPERPFRPIHVMNALIYKWVLGFADMRKIVGAKVEAAF